MKIKSPKNSIIVFVLYILLIPCCKKEKKPTLPILTTTVVSNITATSATSGGNITYDGGAIITSRGVCWSTNINPSISDNKTIDGSGEGSFSSNIINLIGGTKFYVAAYATNSSGTGYGSVQSFSTLGQLPTASTQAATNIQANTAKLNGLVNSNYLSTSVSFDYGLTINYGQSIASTQSPITGSINIPVSADLIGLSSNSTYHFRIKVVNSLGTTTGDDMTFMTIGPISDIDGNIYQTVTIGTQTWMSENLKTTKYSDGTAVPNIVDLTTWAGIKSPSYCWYDNDISNKTIYGALYNWYTVNTGKLCPSGWHVPSDAEWETLSNLVGGQVGGKLKETATAHWRSPNIGADNSTGFLALPGGYRQTNGYFNEILHIGFFWTASAPTADPAKAWVRFIYSEYATLFNAYDWKNSGFSVRCIKD